MASPSQPKSLIFDLEVAPGNADQPDRIFMVGALSPDTGEELERKVDKELPSVVDALDSLGQGASFVLGHNVIWATAVPNGLWVYAGADPRPRYLRESTLRWLETY